MPTARSSTALKSGEFLSDQFPAGLRVLVVDDDPTCLRILEKMLQFCLYKVTKCNRAEIALSKLRDNKNGFDVVISDVHMPDMDGFKLLKHIGLEMDLPVIMMSADEEKDVVMKGVTHGACDYLIKPVRIEALKNIWQHVVRRKKSEWKDLEQSGSMEDSGRFLKNCDEEVDYSSSTNEGNCKSSKRRKDDEEAEDREDTSTLKKSRVVRSVELHQQFVAAVNQLGIEKAVPKKILELMNVSGLTRENVASHLQKYRLYLRRLSGVSPHHSNLNNSFMTPQEAMFGPIPPLNGVDLQALAVAGVGRSSPKSSLISDQRNIFSFENPQLRFGEAQPQHVNSSKPVNLLPGIPTSMEAKQLGNLCQSVQSHGATNMQGSIHGGQNSSLLSQVAQPQSSVRQSIRIPAGVLTNNSIFNFSMNQSRRFGSNYDVFDDLPEQKSRDWNLQNPSLNFNSSHGDLDISSSGLYNQNFADGGRITQKINVSEASLENGQISRLQQNSTLFDYPVKVEAETIPDSGGVLFRENFDGDDLMSTLLRQQQENFGSGPAENEYDFDRYSMYNIPV